jgi:hypothetical protein
VDIHTFPGVDESIGKIAWGESGHFHPNLSITRLGSLWDFSQILLFHGVQFPCERYIVCWIVSCDGFHYTEYIKRKEASMLGTIVIVFMTVIRIVIPLTLILGVGELVRRKSEEKQPLRGA